MIISGLDSFFIENINNIVYTPSDFKTLFKKLDIMMAEEFDCYFYSIILLDDGDNNYYIEYTTVPTLYRITKKLYSLFENKILRRLYGFGKLKQTDQSESNYVTIGTEICELYNAYPIYYNNRIIGFFLLHDNPLNENDDKEKIKYLISQLANGIVGLKRLDTERYLTKKYISSLQILKFLNDLLKESSIESIFYQILNHLFDKTESEAGSVAIKNKDKWITPVELGISEEILEQLKFKDGMNILEFATQIQQIYMIDENQIKEQIDFGDLKINLKSILLVPVMTNEVCENVVVLANYHKDIDEDLTLYIQKICEIAATAIQNYDIISDEDSSYPERQAKLTELRQKFINTLETLLDEIELN